MTPNIVERLRMVAARKPVDRNGGVLVQPHTLIEAADEIEWLRYRVEEERD